MFQGDKKEGLLKDNRDALRNQVVVEKERWRDPATTFPMVIQVATGGHIPTWEEGEKSSE